MQSWQLVLANKSLGNYGSQRTIKNEITESALGSENMPSTGHRVQVGCAIYLKSFKSTMKKLKDNPRENAADNPGLWYC